jgi:hypothetical protein
MAVMNIREKKLLISAVSVLALAAVVVVAMVSRSDATEVPSTAETFSVLETDSVSSTALPDEAQKWLSNLGDFGGPDAPPSEVGVATTPAGDEVVVAGATDSLCAYKIDGGMSNCADADLAGTGQVYTASPDFSASPDGCAGWNILGLMPDGVESLTVDAVGGEGPSTIPVTSNVYTATLPPVRTTLSSGSISVEIPLDQFAAGNTAC